MELVEVLRHTHQRLAVDPVMDLFRKRQVLTEALVTVVVRTQVLKAGQETAVVRILVLKADQARPYDRILRVPKGALAMVFYHIRGPIAPSFDILSHHPSTLSDRTARPDLFVVDSRCHNLAERCLDADQPWRQPLRRPWLPSGQESHLDHSQYPYLVLLS